MNFLFIQRKRKSVELRFCLVANSAAQFPVFSTEIPIFYSQILILVAQIIFAMVPGGGGGSRISGPQNLTGRKAGGARLKQIRQQRLMCEGAGASECKKRDRNGTDKKARRVLFSDKLKILPRKKKWCIRSDLNRKPSDPKSEALSS